jgi:hypothetical protein
MIGERVEHFQGKGTDLGALQSHVTGYLKGDGFRTQSSLPSAQGVVVQAQRVAPWLGWSTPTVR